MPWTKDTASEHNKKATGKKGQQWASIANAVLAKTGDEGQAIRIANAAISREGRYKSSVER